MGFLDSLFGKKKAAPTSPATQPPPGPPLTELEAMNRFGGLALEKQLDFGEQVGELAWRADVQLGTITFGETITYPMQILGTFSEGNQSWLWAWANAQSNLPAEVLRHALKLKQMGQENGLTLLKTPSFAFTANELHVLGCLASGLLGLDAYYIANYGQGAMLVGLQSPAIAQLRKDTHLRVFTVFPQLISQFEVEHRPALAHYLRAKGYMLTEAPGQLVGVRNGQTVTAQFDDQGRLTQLEGAANQ
ncbi:MAG: hypothetical protein MUC97_02490 [Bernardetiaceae bacterium]|jgi:hypothetical protein|nr:hypothetical protein [Bernardetiaceae bacterium]